MIAKTISSGIPVIYKGVLGGGVKANAKTIPLTRQQKFFCWHFVTQNAYLAKTLGVVSESPRKCNFRSARIKKRRCTRKVSGVYEIRQLSELLITINILQSEIRLSEEDAKVILGYMQGHDFMLVLDVGQLVRVDISEEQGSKVPYTMDEVIDLVCEWKYEQLEKAREAVENPKNFAESNIYYLC